MSELRLGLLGCGRIVQLVHLDLLAGMRWSRLVAVADPDAGARAAAAARAPGAALHEHWQDLLSRDDLDGVVVALPSALHAEAAVAALDTGLHVYVEKPLATELADAERVVAAWQRAGTVGMTGFAFRFAQPYLQLRDRLERDRLGRLAAVRTTFCSAPRELAGWKSSRATGGGALLDLASHSVDTLRMLTGGEVAAVTASLASVRSEHDTATLLLELVGGTAGDGLLASCLVSAGAPQADRVEVFGERGGLVADRMAQTLHEVPLGPAPTRPERVRAGVGELLRAPWDVKARVLPAPEPSFATALRAFRTAALRGWPVRPDLEDGLRCLRVLLAAEESAATGRRVELPIHPPAVPRALVVPA
jgi:myo-inositol 2-dehydrogenase / D-chiro-inositol 1-dehydrogenase